MTHSKHLDFEQKGYLLLRNPQHQLQDFLQITERWGHDFVQIQNLSGTGPQQIVGSHLGRTPLPGKTDVFLNAGHNASYPLPLHGELYYQMPYPPALLCFYCETPPLEQGETLLCNGQALFQALPTSIQQLFLEQDLVYTRHSPLAVWQKDYQTQDAKALLQFLKSVPIEGEIHPETGELTTRYTCSALRHFRGDWCFMNNLIPFALRERDEPQATRSRVRLANGQTLPAAALDALLTCSEALQHSIAWQKGDILLVDNRWVLHGRRALLPGPRTLYLRMAQHCRTP